MPQKQTFDLLITSSKKLPTSKIKNIAELIFTPLPYRKETSTILLGHNKNRTISLDLNNFRFICSSLFQTFEKKGIQPGDTILLATFAINNELYILLLLAALISYGVRVFLPMYIETSELLEWLQLTNCTAIITPSVEINTLSRGYQQEKNIIQKIQSIALQHQLSLFDVEADFQLEKILNTPVPHDFPLSAHESIQKAIANTTQTTEAIIFTTSGTTGRSKLVVYEQGAFIRNCLCWQESGLYHQEKLGGSSLIDILPHTISIRAFFNTLWTGRPLGILNTGWVKQTPQKVIPLLKKIQPEVITYGPSTLSILMHFLHLFPEIKNTIFSHIKTLVSTGASYSIQTAQELRNIFGVTIHNAYGLSETQQVLTTVLTNEKDLLEVPQLPLGQPIAGVQIGLKKFSEDTFQLFINSPFGCSYYIDPETKQKIIIDDFFYSGDIVHVCEHKQLFFCGREKLDFFKNGFGAKVPLSFMKQHYQPLYKNVQHIEYYPPLSTSFYLGVAALIFINDTSLSEGRVVHKGTIKFFTKLIRQVNAQLQQTIEPFEFEQRAIKRLLIINSSMPETWKGAISRSQIDELFGVEIELLRRSIDPSKGVRDILSAKDFLISILIRLLPFQNSTFRRMVLQRFLKKSE